MADHLRSELMFEAITQTLDSRRGTLELIFTATAEVNKAA